MKIITRILTILTNILLIVLTGILITTLYKTNLIPLKYLTLIIIISIIFILIISYILINKKTKFIPKLIATLITAILIIILSTILYYLYNTLNFMDNITTTNYEIEEYYIIVLKESEYNYISDIENKNIGTYKNINKEYNNSLNKLVKNIDVKLVEYNNYYDTTKALLKKKVEGIYISSVYKEILDEQINNFNDRVKILDKNTIKLKKDEPQENINVEDESFNVYISGIDTYGNISSISRSDVNMIMTINPKKNKILLTSIPRDYYVKLPGTTGYKDKLTHAGIYGIDTSISTIEALLDIEIDYYIRINFTTLINIVDAIDGIDIYSDKNFTAYTNKNCTYNIGQNHLNGKCALAYARERYSYQEGDRHRIKNQQDVVKAIITKGLSSKSFITKYTEILKTFENSFQTSIPKEKIYQLINNQLDKMPTWQIEQISLNGYDSYNYTYSYPGGKLYVMEPNQNTIITAKNKINELSN